METSIQAKISYNKNTVQLIAGAIIVLLAVIVSIFAFWFTTSTAWSKAKDHITIQYKTDNTNQIVHAEVLYAGDVLFHDAESTSVSQSNFAKKLNTRAKQNIESDAKCKVTEDFILPLGIATYITILLLDSIIEEHYKNNYRSDKKGK